MDEYISRMKEDQDTILYLSGDTTDSILKSPILAKYVIPAAFTLSSNSR